MMTDPIADMLTRIRNALTGEKPDVEIPLSKLKREVARVLKEEGFIEDFRVMEDAPHPYMKVYLKYGPDGEKVIRRITRISRPGRRVYRTADEFASSRVLHGMGVAVVSTSRGVMSDRKCREARVGGEVLCEVW
jgi:small subunit ribosomal protein S8